MLSNPLIPTGGFPLGHSFGANQDVFHKGWPLSYTLASNTQSLAHYQAIEAGKTFTDTNTPPPVMIDIPIDQAIAQVSDADILAYLQSNYGSDGSAYSQKVTSGDKQARLTAALVDKFSTITGIFLDKRWSGVSVSIASDGRQIAVQGYDMTATPADKLAGLLRSAMNTFMGVAEGTTAGDYSAANPFWLPDDNQWVERSDGTTSGINDANVTGTPVKLHQQVWFYLCDHSQIDGSSYAPTLSRSVTDSHTGKNYNQNPFFSIGYIKMTHDPDPSVGQWAVDSDTQGLKGYYRLSRAGDTSDPAAYWIVDSATAIDKWINDNEEIIADACIVIVELICDYFSEGATHSIWAAVNPLLFGMVHCLVTGDSTQLLTAVASAAEWAISQGAASILTEMKTQAPNTLAFLTSTVQCLDAAQQTLQGNPVNGNCPVNSVLKTVAGVGKQIGDVFDKAAATIASEKGIFDALTHLPDAKAAAEAGLLQGIPFGKQMLSTVYDMAYTTDFKAVTDEFAGAVRNVSATAGVATFHDLGRTIDFDSYLSKISDTDWTHDNIKAAVGQALSDAMASGVRPVPPYAEQQTYQGAVIQLASMIQTGQLTHQNTQLRAFKANVTAYQPGYVPPELAQAMASSGQVLGLAPLVKPKAILASPIPTGVTSARNAFPTQTQLTAAANGVPSWGLGPTLTGLMVAGGGTAAAMYFLSKPLSTAIKRPVTPAMIVLGAVAVTAVYWYATRLQVKMPAVTVTPPPTGGAAGSSLPSTTTAVQKLQAASMVYAPPH